MVSVFIYLLKLGNTQSLDTDWSFIFCGWNLVKVVLSFWSDYSFKASVAQGGLKLIKRFHCKRFFFCEFVIHIPILLFLFLKIHVDNFPSFYPGFHGIDISFINMNKLIYLCNRRNYFLLVLNHHNWLFQIISKFNT